MADVINPYAVLGVPNFSDIKVCQAAYRKLAVKYHPDRCKDPELNKKMILINQCIDFLKDPLKKAQLDNPPPPQYIIRWTYSQDTTASWSGYW